MNFIIVSRGAVQKRLIGAQRIFNLAASLKLLGHKVCVVAPEFNYPEVEKYDYGFCDKYIPVSAKRVYLSRLIAKLTEVEKPSRTGNSEITEGFKRSAFSTSKTFNKLRFYLGRDFYYDLYHRCYFRIGVKNYLRALSEDETLRSLLNSPETVLFTSSKPNELAIVGNTAKELHDKIIWVADFRDSPVNNPYSDTERNKYDSKFADIALRGADLITAVSKGIAQSLSEFASLCDLDADRKLLVLYNGFLKQENIEPTKETLRNSKYERYSVIAYVGRLYTQMRIDVLMKALTNPKLASHYRLVYAGPSLKEVDIEVKRIGCQRVVENLGFLPKEQALRVQREADLLLLLKSPQVESGNMTGKFFEYLEKDKPILVLGDSDSEFNEIARKIGGIYVLPYDEEKIKEFLIEFANRWPFEMERNAEEVDKFNWKNLAKGLTEEVERRLKKC